MTTQTTKKISLNSNLRAAVLGAVALATFAPPALRADESERDQIRQLQAQIQALQQQLNAIEQKQAQQDQSNAAAVAAAQAQAQQAQASAATVAKTVQAEPKITIDDTGFNFASNDGSDYIRLHGLVQADSRWYFREGGIPNNDTFLIRRARLIFQGGFDKIFSFLLVPEFGGGGTGVSNAPVIYDANLGVAVSPELQFTFGKFKSPIGLEMLQNDAVLLFPERSLATNLVPSRDVGVMAGGSLFSNTINYTAAVLNGSADNAYTNNVDVDNNKDFVARLIASPFANENTSPLRGLSFGFAGSYGLQNKTAGLTSGDKTDSQQTFFTYNSTVVPYGGASWRTSPQANYYVGPLSVETEYTTSAVNVLSGTTQRELRNTGWQGAVGYILTGEKASYNGFTPKERFDPAAGTWGAWEIAARVDQLKIDPNAFPIFANPAASAREATSLSLGLNWYLSKAVRIDFDFLHTQFDRASTAPVTNLVIGQDEKALMTRVQVGF
jgi:phosphate-selective porin OprO and OprP